MAERLFIAIEPPETIKKKLSSLSLYFFLHDSLPMAKESRIKITNEDQLHLTLRFLGSVESEKLEEIKRCLSQVSFIPFSVHLKGLGIFPRKRESILWAGLEQSEALISLKTAVDTTLANCGFPIPGGKYSPHISLLRNKNMGKILSSIADQYSQAIEGEFKVTGFTLFKSVLLPQGAQHTPLAEYGAPR